MTTTSLEWQLRPGERVIGVTSRQSYRIDTLLGQGGQGEVYRADAGGDFVAVKWYYGWTATPGQRRALEVLIEAGAPSARFLWPVELVTVPDRSGFGYVMPLRQTRFRGINEMMTRRLDPSLRTLAMTGYLLADSFLELHSRGLSYRDISFGNVFFDPETGEVLICDNDNVAVDGLRSGGILGTPRFMAPEVVRGEALPSSKTDLYSLAVLLF